jgi:hypothetical protein
VGPRTVLDGCENLLPTRIRSPDHPARSVPTTLTRPPCPTGRFTFLSLKFISVVLKTKRSYSTKTLYIPVTKTNRLTLFKEIAVNFELYTKHVYMQSVCSTNVTLEIDELTAAKLSVFRSKQPHPSNK